MRLNERWLWLGPTEAPEDCGVTAYSVRPGAWVLAGRTEALGPFDDRSILRALRMACTPTIDGCELGPWQLGFRELSCSRKRLRRGPRWTEVPAHELPASVTVYDEESVRPVQGCCTVFSEFPKLSKRTDDRWREFVTTTKGRARTLRMAWNAHPAGSLVVAEGELTSGFTVLDFPAS